jgi:hypothetical protein
MTILFLQFLSLTGTLCGSVSTSTLPADRPTNEQAVAVAPAILSAAGGSGRYAQSAQQPVLGWQYEQKGNSNKATLRSVNAIQFAYPHTQMEHVTLGMRHRNGDTFVYLETANGLFTRSFQNGSAQVQVDQLRPVTYSLSAAANGRANIIFFDKADKVPGQLKKARTVTVRLRFAGQPERTLQFQTAGLRWEH